MRAAAARACWTAGSSSAVSTPRIAITTTSSIRLKPRRFVETIRRHILALLPTGALRRTRIDSLLIHMDLPPGRVPEGDFPFVLVAAGHSQAFPVRAEGDPPDRARVPAQGPEPDGVDCIPDDHLGPTGRGEVAAIRAESH